MGSRGTEGSEVDNESIVRTATLRLTPESHVKNTPRASECKHSCVCSHDNSTGYLEAKSQKPKNCASFKISTSSGKYIFHRRLNSLNQIKHGEQSAKIFSFWACVCVFLSCATHWRH